MVSALLYGVHPTDPTTLAGVSAIILAVTALATLLPAQVGARVQPMVALRQD